MGGSNDTPFFQLKIFYGCQIDLQSWNPTFLGIRSPNPLPISSGLGNLTTRDQTPVKAACHTRHNYLPLPPCLYFWSCICTIKCWFEQSVLWHLNVLFWNVLRRILWDVVPLYNALPIAFDCIALKKQVALYCTWSTWWQALGTTGARLAPIH